MTFISLNTSYPPKTGPLSFGRLAAQAKRMLAEATERRKINTSVGQLSENYLRDIGLTRNDVSSIAQLPLPSSGALELFEIAKSRAGNW